jgi:UDP-N-acetylglucosamine acyltransferase
MRAGREPDAAAMIDPDSRVHPDAVLAPGVEVGPWTTIGAGVEIGAGTRVGAHVVIAGAVRIGRDNRIHPYCSIGEPAQIKGLADDRGARVEIGDRNVFREYCSVNRGSPKDQGLTRIGNDNYFMTGAHVAHDCVVGSHAVFANNATLAGHVEVGDHAFLSGFCGIHQFCRVGESAFVGPSAVVLKDVPPFVTVAGNTAQPHGLNRVGLRRRGFSADEIDALRRAYKLLYRKGLTRAEAQLRLDALAPASAHLQRFAEFLRASKRGIVR